jgi:type VI secretion system protein ImpJ
VPAFNLRPIFQDKSARRFLIYLAAPAFNPGRPNVAVERTPNVRYYQQTMTLEDENLGGNPQTICVRALNLQILAANQDRTGYQVLPIASVEKSDQADAGVQLDHSYVPPLLACDAWKPLADDILGGIHDRLIKKIDWFSDFIASQGITLDRQLPGDVLALKQLQQLQEAATVLGMLVTARGVHPIDAFLELSRMVGQMAIFDASRRPPELPKYDHDNLGPCFAQLKLQLDTQLNRMGEPEYQERPFIGAGWRMQVGLEPAWLDPSSRVYIGVQSTLDAAECIALLTQSGQLDMKLGSSDRVDDLFRLGAPGLKFRADEQPAQELPKLAGQVYFQVVQDAKDPEWLNVRKTLSLALRLNENRIVGSIQGQRRLTIKVGGRHVGMQFSLYVVPAKKS